MTMQKELGETEKNLTYNKTPPVNRLIFKLNFVVLKSFFSEHLLSASSPVPGPSARSLSLPPGNAKVLLD